MISPALATIGWEHHLLENGYVAVAGVDEVGRGPLAGPLMAGAVILPPLSALDTHLWQSVRDSKVLTAARREQIAAGILQHARAWSIGTVESAELDEIGVAAANRVAMERAVAALAIEPDFLLLDATTVDLGIPQIGIIDGDALSLSIGAASIIAKVARDAVMMALDTEWPMYGFAKHKGYGTAHHLAALRTFGPCPIHRFRYGPVRAAAIAAGLIDER